MNCGLVHRQLHSHKTLFSPGLQRNRRRTCEVEVKSTSQARRRQRPAIVLVANGVRSHTCMLERYPGSTGDCLAGSSAAYENQALHCVGIHHNIKTE